MPLFTPVEGKTPGDPSRVIHLDDVDAAGEGAGSNSQLLQVDSEESTGTRSRPHISYTASQLLFWQYLPAPSPDVVEEYLSLLGKLTVSESSVLDVTAYRKGDVNILLSSAGVTTT